jgi:hypothetical protein
MSATFSINIGQIIESSKKLDVFKILLELPDNTKKMISPRDVRDAFFTTWASSPIKLTTPGVLGSQYAYIGIDSSDPNNRDIKKPILIGKRQYGNLDIMNSNLVSTNNADIFFYNTKPDNVSQDSTKISILAGTDSTLFYNAPYIQTVSGTTSLNMNIHNPALTGGAINIFSSAGRVAINGIVFPTAAETAAGASTGKVLKYFGTYPNGFLNWDDSTVSLASVGSLTAPTYIYGSTVSVNGFPIEFINDSYVPGAIGGIPMGASFGASTFNNPVTGTLSNWPIIEVLRQYLYPYIEPVLSLSVVNPSTGTTYAEVGTTPSVQVVANMKIYPRDPSEWVSDWTLIGTTYSHTTRGQYSLTLQGFPGTGLTISTVAPTYSATPNVDKTYTFALSNNPGFTASGYPAGFTTYSISKSIRFISPFYSVFQSTTSLNATTVETIIGSTYSVKKVVPYTGSGESVKFNTQGSGYLHFSYPYSYGPVQQILDPNGFLIHDVTNPTSSIYTGFTYSTTTITPNSPYAYYGTYRIYRTLHICSYSGGGNFELIF